MKSKIRQSNIELLRCIAMLMVLVLHADFKSFGAPGSIDIIAYPINSTVRVLLEMLSIVAVNVFILISGWFSIKPSLKGFAKFAFQCLFFSVGVYISTVLLGLSTFSSRGIAECFAIKADDYWFIPSYICLYFFSPVLNTFLNNAEEKTIKRVIVCFFVFQTLYSFIGNGGAFLMKGYSALSFIGLYLLSGYVRRYVDVSIYNNHIYLYGYLAISIVLTCTYLFLAYNHCESIASRLILYSNPLVILSALLLLIYFTTLNFTSIVVNRISLSCFAVYLLHCNPNLFGTIFIQSIRNVSNECFFSFLMLFSVVILWFITAILIDQIRIILWNKIAATKVCCYLFDNNRVEGNLNL